MTFEKIREMLSRQMDIPEESITMDSRLVGRPSRPIQLTLWSL